jgi:hypothetical protein
VEAYLADAASGLASADSVTVGPFRSKFGLEYLGAPAIGVSTGGVMGTALGGSVQAFFSDMLNDNVVGTTVYSTGGIKGLGAEAFYLNQKRRLNWGVGLGRVPYIIGAGSGVRDTIITRGGQRTRGLVYEDQIARLYVDEASLMARYPLSATRRLEASVSASRQRYDIDGVSQIVVGNQVIGEARTGGNVPAGVQLTQASIAYVGDYSSFGTTSPIAGGRYRVEASPIVGDLQFGTLLADYRRYLLARPVTLALRGMHYGRYGRDAENTQWMQPLYVGYSSMVRGYAPETFSSADCGTGGAASCPAFDRLLGSRIAVANAELRIPLFGPKQLALIPSFLPVEISPFVDAGVAWTSAEGPTLGSNASGTGRTPIVSAGLSSRVNLFNALVLEVFYAVPFQRSTGGRFGFQLAPGW